MAIILGKLVEDKVSGFRGIAVSRTTYLQGCDRIAVRPRMCNDGELPELQDFDEPDLIVVGDGVLPPVVKHSTGGPRHISTK